MQYYRSFVEQLLQAIRLGERDNVDEIIGIIRAGAPEDEILRAASCCLAQRQDQRQDERMDLPDDLDMPGTGTATSTAPSTASGMGMGMDLGLDGPAIDEALLKGWEIGSWPL